MRTFIFSLLFIGLIATGVIVWQMVKTPEMGGASNPMDTLTGNETENASPEDESTTAGNPDSNPNPDLNTDSNGLSKATVTIKTNKGNIVYKFYPKDAPNTVKRIIELINQGFYNGLTFHRVIPGFVIQGGDPDGDGTGGSGQKLQAEFNSRKHQEGAVAMARAADPNSADSQFYIVRNPQPHLDGKYTVFGQVIEGMDVVRKIEQNDKMISVTIQ